MKIYFAASIRGGRDDQQIYFDLIQALAGHGEVLTEHFGGAGLSSYGETGLSDADIYTRDMEWLRSADVVVAEVTTPSLGVGYELGQAEALGKRVLCLYRPAEGKRLSAMLSGNPALETREYADAGEAKEIFEDYFSAAYAGQA